MRPYSSSLQPATSSEKMIWQSIQRDELDPSSTLSYVFSIQKKITLDKIQKIILRLLEMHAPCLNFRFVEYNGTLCKQYFPPSQKPVNVIPSCQKRGKILFLDPLTSLYHFQWQEQSSHNLLIVHLSHLVLDGASYVDFCKALNMAFENNVSSTNNEIFSIPVESKDDLEYWQSYLYKKSLYQPLPFLPSLHNKELVYVTHILNESVFNRLKLFNEKYSATFFQTITTALAITLHCYLKDEEDSTSLCLSYFVSNRVKGQPIGCHTNLLPFFIDCSENKSALSILNNVKKTRASQRPFQHVPLENLLALVDKSLNFQQFLLNVVVNHSGGLLPLEIPKFCNDVENINNHSYIKPLTLIYNYNDQQLLFRLESNIGAQYQLLLKEFLLNFEKSLIFLMENPSSSLSKLNLGQKELPFFVGRELPPKTKPLFDYFLEKAVHHKEEIAIKDEQHTVTYQAAFMMVWDVVRKLEELPEEKLAKGIGIYLTRTYHLPVALLSCLASQVCFIPISDELPIKAREELIQVTQLSVLIVDDLTLSTLSNFLSENQLVFINVNELNSLGEVNFSKKREPHFKEDIAYTLFTSGSTGKPKGVMITYDNLFNFLRSMSYSPGLTEQDTMLAMTAISFDISVNELLLPLFCGAATYVVGSQVRKDSKKLGEFIDQGEVHVVQATPSCMEMLKQSSWTNKNKLKLRFWVGGEELNLKLANYFLDQGVQIFNMYGPTETTIWAGTTQVKRDALISIGKPLDNTSFSLVDKNGRTPPLGVPGELVIHGALVARGYSNHPNKPFVKGINGMPAYRTGDKVVALGKDLLVFLKRLDEQVKIRGYRIELQEVTSMVKKLKPNLNVITILREKPEPHLCCFYNYPKPSQFDPDELIEKLSTFLPDYKVPQALIYLPDFPLTNSGKIDRKYLATAPLKGLSVTETLSSKVLSKNNAGKLEELRRLIDKQFNVDIDDENDSLVYYGFNSLSFNALSVLLEKTYNKSIPSHEFYQLRNLKSIAERCGLKDDSVKNINIKKTSNEQLSTRIAVIGYDALMPGGLDAEGFWQSLISGKNSIGGHKRHWLSSDEKAGFIEDIEGFDRHFFKLSPLEVSQMDPRQRLLMQCAYRVLEQAGYAGRSLEGEEVACYIAGTGLDYLISQTKHGLPAHPYTLSGNSLAMLANRLSYYFNWRGPSITIDTACSGSLSALARGVDSLRLSKSSLCFVGAANLIIDPGLSKALNEGRFLSPVARCASFSNEADGYVRGEGVVGFLLKPLNQAEKDGDQIHAVIESIVENHGGRAASLTAPSQEAQEELLLKAYGENFSEKLTYIETHGTGTKLGDPIEIDALKGFEQKALQNNKKTAIYLGAVKSNIGHLEAAAGLASMLKVILAMKYKELPGNLHCHSVNSLIDLSNSKFELLNEKQPWVDAELVAGISSFGFGGANSHVVLSNHQSQEQIFIEQTQNQNLPLVFCLSASTKKALQARIRSLIFDLKSLSHVSLLDIACTLLFGREDMIFRFVIVASNKEDLAHQLKEALLKNLLEVPKNIPSQYASYVEKYLAGQPVSWGDLFDKRKYKKVSLTPYEFDVQPFWFTQLQKPISENIDVISLLKIKNLSKNEMTVVVEAAHPFLAEHKVFQKRIFPGVAHLELVLNLLRLNNRQSTAFTIENVFWLRPLICEAPSISILVKIKPIENGVLFEISDEAGLPYSRGTLLKSTALSFNDSWVVGVIDQLAQVPVAQYNTEQIYKIFNSLGIDYGAYFKGIKSIFTYQNIAKTIISIKPLGSFVGLLDSAFQTGMAIDLKEPKPGLMPFALGGLKIYDEQALRNVTCAHVYTKKLSTYRTNLVICDDKDSPLLSLIDLGVKPSLLRPELESAILN